MFPVLICTVVGAITAYLMRVPTKAILGSALVGAVVGLAIFGTQVAVVAKPKVPCWTEAAGVQIFRAVPFFCNARATR